MVDASLHFLPKRGIGGKQALGLAQVVDRLRAVVASGPQLGALDEGLAGELRVLLGQVQDAAKHLVRLGGEGVRLVDARQAQERRHVEALDVEDFVPGLGRVLLVLLQHQGLPEQQEGVHAVPDPRGHLHGLDQILLRVCRAGLFEEDAPQHEAAVEVVRRELERRAEMLARLVVVAEPEVHQAQERPNFRTLPLDPSGVDEEIEQHPGLPFGFVDLVDLIEGEFIPRVIENDIHVLVRDLLGRRTQGELREPIRLLLLCFRCRSIFSAEPERQKQEDDRNSVSDRHVTTPTGQRSVAVVGKWVA